ncbi:MAG: hypothetical protein RLZZ568_500, partial [Cyanobacteriota bacterium]
TPRETAKGIGCYEIVTVDRTLNRDPVGNTSKDRDLLRSILARHNSCLGEKQLGYNHLYSWPLKFHFEWHVTSPFA